jgi:drug/metabolite transporter (DMT)-like permease
MIPAKESLMTTAAAAAKKHTLTIILAFAAIYLIWGTTYLGMRIAVETLPPFLMAGTRFLTAGFVLFITLRLTGTPMPRRLEWRSALIIGALLLVGGNGLITWAEQQVPSSTASLVIATVPLWIALFDWMVFKEGRPGPRVTAGLLLGLVGIGLLVGPGQLQGTAVFSTTALLVLLLAPLLWSMGSLYSRGAVLPENAFMAPAIEMIAGGALLLFVGLLLGEWRGLDTSAFSGRSLAAMAYLTIFGSIIAFPAYVWLLQNVAASKVATYSYVNPVIAVFLGWLILDELITPTTLVAVVAIVIAVILITTGKPQQKQISRPTSQRVSGEADKLNP